MRRIIVNTFSPDFVFESFSSERATRRTRSWSMPPESAPSPRLASAFWYCVTIRRVSSRSAAPMDRPARPTHPPPGAGRPPGGGVGDRAGRDVGGHVELAPAHDAEVDHALAGRGVEAAVGGRQAGVLERVHQLVPGLAVLDPAEVLPDG